MSSPLKDRKHLAFVDPARATPHFGWQRMRRGAGREVVCEGVGLRIIARRYGTPTYVYSRRAIEEAFDALERGLRPLPHLLCYAVKANGNLSLLKLLARRGSGFDIVSGGELDYLGYLGVPGEKIVFSGVGKTREEIRAALNYRTGPSSSRGILLFNVESQEELGVLLEESSRRNVVPRASIRVNPDIKAGGHPHISTGLAGHKFGVSWPEARSLYLLHRSSRHIEWRGISAHIGSQIVKLAPFQEALGRLAGYVLELRQQGVPLSYLDFGGGLGVRYTQEIPVSPTAYARMIRRIVRPLGVSLLLEPGRAIVGPSGVLLSRVLYRKQSGAKKFVVIDAGMNDLARPVLYDAPHPITRVCRPDRETGSSTERADVVGPVCETGDCFLEDWPLGRVEPGDLVAIWVAGAYGMVQASNYNGRGRPAEVLVSGPNTHLIRRRETAADLRRTLVLD